MLYIYRRAASEGARLLAEAMPINARKLNDLARAHFGQGVRTGDTVICWGEVVPPNLPTGVKVLNGAPIGSKYADAVALSRAGVPTVEVSLTRPPVQPTQQVEQPFPNFEELSDELEAFGGTPFNRTSPVYRAAVVGLNQKLGALAAFLAAPPPPALPPEVWLGRTNDHIGGTDLLNPTNRPAYWSKKLNLVDEVRIHSFKGKSIRAGRKEPREGFTQVAADGHRLAHPWIRSYDGGWKINYDGFESSRAMRDAAHRAVAALGLDFGAVDLGLTTQGEIVVLEVNRAPGLEGGTPEAYGRAIASWLQEGEAARPTAPAPAAAPARPAAARAAQARPTPTRY